ncbi:hypothetical protein E4U38_006706 [Claviceps purpurea]|nr:hypothetical protein E4U38_006706 [Claviceps purpurea]
MKAADGLAGIISDSFHVHLPFNPTKKKHFITNQNHPSELQVSTNHKGLLTPDPSSNNDPPRGESITNIIIHGITDTDDPDMSTTNTPQQGDMQPSVMHQGPEALTEHPSATLMNRSTLKLFFCISTGV